MGEKLKRLQAKQFKQRAERAYERTLGTGDLFSRVPDMLTRSFNCEGERPVPGLIGETVTAYAVEDGVRVVDGSTVVGEVLGEEAAPLAEKIRAEPGCPGFAPAVVEDASEVTGDFRIRLVADEEGE